MTDRGIYICPNVIERMVASIGSHVMNLCNLDHRLFLKGRAPANFRTHLVYISPSGWTKSFYFRLFLKHMYGLLWNRGVFPIDVHSTFSTASWFGTLDSNNGEVQERQGVFETYKRGIIGADDYQPLVELFDGRGIGQDEIALMTALDTDEAVKNLAVGQLRIKGVGMTAWFGMRPTKLKLTSGLARRFVFPRFFPSRFEARTFRDLARSELEPNFELEVDEEKTPLQRPIIDTDAMIVGAGVTDLNLDQIYAYLDKFDIPHFEENLYRNLAIGWSIANGEYPDIKLDETGKEMLKDEMESRDILRNNPYKMLLRKIILAEPDEQIPLNELERFLTSFLQFQESEAKGMIRHEKCGGRIEFDTWKGKKYVQLAEGVE